MISKKSNRSQTDTCRADCLSASLASRLPVYALSCLFLVLVGCSSGGPEKGQKGRTGKNTAVAVTTELCRSLDVPIILQATGRVEASATVGIRSRINGSLDTVHFKEGQMVRKGDILFGIDNRPSLAQVQAKEALLAKDLAELTQARRALERYLPAARKGYVSQDQADQASAAVAGLEAAVQADKAALASARLDLEFCSLIAPIDGIAGEIQADAGNLIKANDDTPLVTINRITPIRLSFTLPGVDLPEVLRYQAKGPLEVQAVLAGKDGAKTTGTLSFIDNSIDPSTGTIALKADFANGGQELWPGQFTPVSVRLTTRRAALVVPVQAVQTGQDGAHVYVVRQNATVEYRQIVAGARSGADMIIEKGLTAGERVVTDGHLQLADGGAIVDRTAGPAGGGNKDRQRGTP